MEKSVEKAIQELMEKAKREGYKCKIRSSRSSLHRLIKTQRQADRFMKLLREERDK